MIRRTLITLMALAALAAIAGTAAPTAAAASAPCWKRLLNDWYGDHRIDGSYPVSCYRDAINNLPEDVDAYTEAREDIQRALLAAIRRSPSGTLQPTDVVPPEPAPTNEPGSGSDDGNGGGNGEDPGDDEDDTTETVAGPGAGDDDGLIGFFRPSNADEIPLPLLALAALALILLVAAAASFAARRVQSRRLRPEPIRSRPAPPEA